jgi:adenylate cyclase
MLSATTPVELPAAAFLFVDIVSFTAYTEAHGDAAAAVLAWRLRLGVEEQLGADAHVVKSLGDAVMVRIADPAEAIAAGARIASSALPAQADPPVRVGIHYGPAVECAGDFFGAAVNVAARVAALAGSGHVLVTEAVAAAAGERALRRRAIALETIGERVLRNVTLPVLIHGAVVSERSARSRSAIARRPRAPLSAGGRSSIAGTGFAHA